MAAKFHRDFRLLIADDDAGFRETVQEILTPRFETIAVDSGEAAIDVVRQTSVHLVLTDVIMPGMSGPALAAYVAEHYPAIKIVYMSGYTDNVIAHHGILEPGTQFIAKPFTVASLTSKVREVLDGK